MISEEMLDCLENTEIQLDDRIKDVIRINHEICEVHEFLSKIQDKLCDICSELNNIKEVLSNVNKNIILH